VPKSSDHRVRSDDIQHGNCPAKSYYLPTTRGAGLVQIAKSLIESPISTEMFVYCGRAAGGPKLRFNTVAYCRSLWIQRIHGVTIERFDCAQIAVRKVAAQRMPPFPSVFTLRPSRATPPSRRAASRTPLPRESGRTGKSFRSLFETAGLRSACGGSHKR
jgi:hypothetical protein